ncbi:superoxide dismutase [Mn/Fe]-like [Liolophura sinensis]|uniref:superoxide dismutase [Mn/Fe]-like n=1 Tax=Liolophura sinensis TaxID=3198878 RepID=UPI0031586551
MTAIFALTAKYLLIVHIFLVVISIAIAPPYDGMNEYQEEYKLPPLQFGYEELQPLLDGATVRVHHTGHHAAYTRKMNGALREWRKDSEVGEKELSESSILTVLRNIDRIPEKYQTVLKNNGGGFVNHNIYWSSLSPNPSERQRYPEGKLSNDIEREFGDFQNFQLIFTQEATSLFGSGYVWLSRDPIDGSLVISKTANQDSAISSGLCPILVLDVWEHAYYLKHQNKRPKYIDDWWLLVDWSRVSQLDDWWRKVDSVHDEL